MKENIKLLYCILGSIMLVLLESPVFTSAKFALFEGRGYGESLYGLILNGICNILSFIGFILVIIFSVILIIRNLNFKNN